MSLALPVPVVPAKAMTLGEMKENDVDEQRRDTVSKGWSKDQWISGVLERAIGVVARSAEMGLQRFRLAPLEAGTARYAVSDDKHLSTFYANDIYDIVDQYVLRKADRAVQDPESREVFPDSKHRLGNKR
jgi:hypothetical protein